MSQRIGVLPSMPRRAGARGPRPPELEGRLRYLRSRTGLRARADPRERDDVVGERREDRVAVVVLRRREAVEVLRAVGRPARPDEERDHRQRACSQTACDLGGERVLHVRLERALPLVQEARRAGIREVLPVAGRGARPDPRGSARSGAGSRRRTRTASPARRPARAASAPSCSTRPGTRSSSRARACVLASMPIACRFLVMICSEATQSDQPEITWIWNETGIALRVDQLAAVVGEAVVASGASWRASGL